MPIDSPEIVALAIEFGIAKKCRKPACTNLLATGESPEGLMRFLREKEITELVSYAGSILELANSIPRECHCEHPLLNN